MPDAPMRTQRVADEKKPALRRLLLACAKAYFFSSGFDSLGEEGVVGEGVPAAPPAELEAAAPVPPALPAASVPAAGGVMGGVVGAGVAVGALGAGGGVVTVFCSSFWQAVRPTATRATTRSERVILFSFVRTGSTFQRVSNARFVSSPHGRYPRVMRF
jgi:hypothetical protein